MIRPICCFFFAIFFYFIILAELRYIWRAYTRYSVFVCTFGLLIASLLVAKL